MSELMNGWFPVFPEGLSISVCLVIDFYSIPGERASFRCGAGLLPLKICPLDACLGRFRGMPVEWNAFWA